MTSTYGPSPTNAWYNPPNPCTGASAGQAAAAVDDGALMAVPACLLCVAVTGSGHNTMVCQTVIGFGAGMKWILTVAGLVSAQSSGTMR